MKDGGEKDDAVDGNGGSNPMFIPSKLRFVVMILQCLSSGNLEYPSPSNDNCLFLIAAWETELQRPSPSSPRTERVHVANVRDDLVDGE